MFRAADYLKALKLCRPEIFTAAEAAVANGKAQGRRFVANAASFEICPSDSIDYAVMEHAEQVACVPVSMGWSDVGSWDSLHEISEKDVSGNAARGEILLLGAKNCFVHSEGQRVTLIDVEDLIVIVSDEDVMILRRGESQKVRKVIEALDPTKTF